MSENRPAVTLVAGHVETVVDLAHAVVKRAVVDREAAASGLESALVGLLGWAVVQGDCVVHGLGARTPQGVVANVRSMLETLITALYLTEAGEPESVLEERLDRFYRGVRARQIKLRNALDEYPALKRYFNVDEALAKRERDEFRAAEDSLPASRRVGQRHWAGLRYGLKSVADKVGLGSDYAVQYRLHSGAIHAGRPWDTAPFDPNGVLVIPDLDANFDLAIAAAFDALRYVAWTLEITHSVNAVSLYQSEQKTLSQYEAYMQPVDALFDKGIVGPTA